MADADQPHFSSSEEEAAYWRQKFQDEQSKKEQSPNNTPASDKPAAPNGDAQTFGCKIPIFTCIMMLVCTGMFIWMMAETGGIQAMRDNPLGGPIAQNLIYYGAKYGPCIRNEGQWWRLLSNNFVFAGVVPFALHVLMVGKLGYDIESSYGAFVAGGVYLFGGICGNVMSNLILPTMVSGGGMIPAFAWSGLVFVSLVKQWNVTPNKPFAVGCCICSFTFQVGMGLLPGIDNWGFVGSFLGGVLLSFALLPRPIKDADGDLEMIETNTNNNNTPYLTSNKGSNPYAPDDDDEKPPSYDEAVNHPPALERQNSMWKTATWKLSAVSQYNSEAARMKDETDDKQEELKQKTLKDAWTKNGRIGEMVVFAFLSLIYLIVLLVVYFETDPVDCDWCKYFDCIPVYNWCVLDDRLLCVQPETAAR